MELDGHVNVLPATPVTVLKKQTRTPDKRASGISAIPSGLTTVSPEKVAEMMDTIDNLQETVDKRKSVLDQIVPRQN
jgi:hypothetical protein